MSGSAEFRIGKRIPRYRIEGVLGAAGGNVYLAQDLRLKGPVALKVLSAELTADERFACVCGPSRSRGDLDHPNIVRSMRCSKLIKSRDLDAPS